MHVTFTVYRDYVTFNLSDGRTGSEPNAGPGLLNGHETVVRLMRELGITSDWTYEVIHA